MNTGINKQLKLPLDWGDEDEKLTGDVCPVCGYPIVLEYGLEVCYRCGWSREDEINIWYWNKWFT